MIKFCFSKFNKSNSKPVHTFYYVQALVPYEFLYAELDYV